MIYIPLVEEQLIGKGFIVSLVLLFIFAFSVYQVIQADPSNAKEVFMALKEPIGYILAFYIGNRGPGIATK